MLNNKPTTVHKITKITKKYKQTKTKKCQPAASDTPDLIQTECVTDSGLSCHKEMKHETGSKNYFCLMTGLETAKNLVNEKLDDKALWVESLPGGRVSWAGLGCCQEERVCKVWGQSAVSPPLAKKGKGRKEEVQSCAENIGNNW